MEYIGKNYRGRDAYLADIPAAWWRLWRACVARDHPDIEIVLIQAAGSAAASAGTHADGWAIDLQTWHLTREQRERLVAHMRRYGASGTWYRYPPAFEPHIHAALDPGRRTTNSSYQVAAVRAGYDGLGSGGRRGRDIHPAPAEWITAEEGIRQMAARFPDYEDDTMISQDGLNQIARTVDRNVLGAAAGSYGSFFDMQRITADNVRKLLERTQPVRRGAPEGDVAMIQEIADAKSLSRANSAQLAELDGKVNRILEMLEAQRG